MDGINLMKLKKAYHFALQDHELAVADFMSAPTPQNTLRMSKAYERAAALRQELQDEKSNRSAVNAVIRLGALSKSV